MVNPLPKVPVVIVGLGAAGGVASYILTKAGIDVVGIEAGPYLGPADYLKTYDELQGWLFKNVLGEPKINHEVPTVRQSARDTAQPPAAASRMANGVGGSSVHMSGQYWRFREDDFKIRSTTVDRYGESALPEGSAVEDWPISYDDLEPYYEKIEYLLGVSGAGGSNPFESPRNKDYPMPPLQRTGFTNLVADTLDSLGYNPFPLPAMINSQVYNGRQPCTYCGYCTGYGCWNESKSSTLVTAIRAAEETGKLEIRANCRVTRILSNDAGKASGVVYLDDQGVEQEQPAGVVILASYTHENNRLLFLSASDAYPDGLGNTNGQLGKYYSIHSYLGAQGWIEGKQFNKQSGTYAQSTAFDDFDGDAFDHTGLGFIRGGLGSASSGESQPIAFSRGVAPGVPAWGSGYKKFLKEQSGGQVSVGMQIEVLMYESNFVDLDPTHTDKLGLPRLRITFDHGVNEAAMDTYFPPKMEEIVNAMGGRNSFSYPTSPIAVNSHSYGGTRMGDDPANSVTNKYGIAHDVSNLMILGGSNFVSVTGYNPTETIQAHAWYAPEYLAANFDAVAD